MLHYKYNVSIMSNLCIKFQYSVLAETHANHISKYSIEGVDLALQMHELMDNR